METNTTWYLFTPGQPPSWAGWEEWESWMGQIGVMDDGTVFIPAVYTGAGDMAVVLCASFDGVPTVTEDGHVYVPADWVKREYPQNADVVDKILRHVKAVHK